MKALTQAIIALDAEGGMVAKRAQALPARADGQAVLLKEDLRYGTRHSRPLPCFSKVSMSSLAVARSSGSLPQYPRLVSFHRWASVTGLPRMVVLRALQVRSALTCWRRA